METSDLRHELQTKEVRYASELDELRSRIADQEAKEREESGEALQALTRTGLFSYLKGACESCGRSRLEVCFDCRVRCEKCGWNREATRNELQLAFTSTEGFFAKFGADEETSKEMVKRYT